ncbi:MAG: hypothetical protein EP329_06660 [Deltaproteobacteria bacterium]|nr:MAG: hypothetical protein EP329_06660 [Deltaproteobacteria bacterium]
MAAPRAWAALVALALAVAVTRPAWAIDYPVHLPLPDWDVAVGLTGGVAFDEVGGVSHTGALASVDLGLLDGVLGLHLGLRTHREGESWRVGGLVELTAWYVVLLGVGCRFGHMVESGGPDVADDEVGLTVLVGIPFPLARLDEGRAGSLVLMPFARPGLRFDGGQVEGFHEVGLSLRWTSFGW